MNAHRFRTHSRAATRVPRPSVILVLGLLAATACASDTTAPPIAYTTLPPGVSSSCVVSETYVALATDQTSSDVVVEGAVVLTVSPELDASGDVYFGRDSFDAKGHVTAVADGATVELLWDTPDPESGVNHATLSFTMGPGSLGTLKTENAVRGSTVSWTVNLTRTSRGEVC